VSPAQSQPRDHCRGSAQSATEPARYPAAPPTRDDQRMTDTARLRWLAGLGASRLARWWRRFRDLRRRTSGLRVPFILLCEVSAYTGSCHVLPVRARRGRDGPRHGAVLCRPLTGRTGAAEQTTSKHGQRTTSAQPASAACIPSRRLGLRLGSIPNWDQTSIGLPGQPAAESLPADDPHGLT
jgi:hypothetical protein